MLERYESLMIVSHLERLQEGIAKRIEPGLIIFCMYVQSLIGSKQVKVQTVVKKGAQYVKDSDSYYFNQQ